MAESAFIGVQLNNSLDQFSQIKFSAGISSENKNITTSVHLKFKNTKESGKWRPCLCMR